MTINMEKKKRLANLDLLKVVSMMMIVCLHYLGFGNIFGKATLSDANYYVAWIFELLSIVGVNCFILCTGYLMCDSRFRFSKVIYLWLQIFSISLVIFIVAAINNPSLVTRESIKHTFLPINSEAYWYMSAYFAFYLISPLLLWIVRKVSVEQLKKLAITLVIIFALSPFQWTSIENGYHFVWFCVLFFVAAYIRRADLFKKRVRVYFKAYLGFTLLLLTIKVVCDALVKTTDSHIFDFIDVRNYNFLFTFLSSLMLFSAFKNIRIKNKRIAGFATFLSTLTLGVYLIHENPLMRAPLWLHVVNPLSVFDKPYFALHLILSVLIVFFVCALLEYFRYLLFKLFGVPQLCDKLGSKLQSLADRVFSSDITEKL